MMLIELKVAHQIVKFTTPACTQQVQSQARGAYDLTDCQRCCVKWIKVFELLTMIESMEII